MFFFLYFLGGSRRYVDQKMKDLKNFQSVRALLKFNVVLLNASC